MEVVIKNIELSPVGRLFAISDIHSYFDQFQSLLECANFSEKDALVIVGDMLEKSNQNLRTLRKVMELAENGNVCTTLGNSELWLLQLLTGSQSERDKAWNHLIHSRYWWEWTAFDEMLEGIGEKFDENIDLNRVLPRIRQKFSKEIDFLQSLPTVLRLGGFTFVHAALPSENDDVISGCSLQSLVNSDDFYSSAQSFKTPVVVGHWPSMLCSPGELNANPLIDPRRKIISIDGGIGAKKMGQLNMVSLTSDLQHITWIAEDSLPKVTAMECQEYAQGKTLIKWTDRFVENPRQISQLMSCVTFHGADAEVPTKLLFPNEGKIACGDFCSTRLKVSAGDTISMIAEMDGGIYGKHNGICGVYIGKYEKCTL